MEASMSSAETCNRPGCAHELGDAYYQLPEDRRLSNPPRFCSSACAANERLNRNWRRREGFDANRPSL
jgi:hypothetical protein